MFSYVNLKLSKCVNLLFTKTIYLFNISKNNMFKIDFVLLFVSFEHFFQLFFINYL